MQSRRLELALAAIVIGVILVIAANASLVNDVVIPSNGTIGNIITAASGLPADIQNAVNMVASYGNGTGTVIIPAGTWTWVDPPYTSFGSGGHAVVLIPAGVSVIGTGLAGVQTHTGTVATMSFAGYTPQTILNLSEPTAAETIDTPMMFGIDGENSSALMTGKASRISGIEFIGPTPQNATIENEMNWDQAIMAWQCVNVRIDHCTFVNWPGAAVSICANDGRAGFNAYSTGVVDHCNFTDPYKLSGSGWVWGYGVSVGGDCHLSAYYNIAAGTWQSTGFPDLWDKNVADYFGKFRIIPGCSFVYVEDNLFTYMRHCVTGNEGAFYCVRWNKMVQVICGYGQRGYIDAHGQDGTGVSGGARGCEAYDNLEIDTNAGGWGWAYLNNFAASMRGGSWLFYNNTWLVPSADTGGAMCWITNADNLTYYVPERMLNNTYIWGNTCNNTAISPTVYNDDPSFFINGGTGGWIAGDTNMYFLRAPTLAQDRFTYTPYPYPMPLSPSGTP
jgi:hypothetical protein